MELERSLGFRKNTLCAEGLQEENFGATFANIVAMWIVSGSAP
jgi:hypothetical protein